MYRVGVTGGIASGKTTVCHLFARHGVAIIDADEVARELVQIGSDCYQRIVAYFGSDCLLPDNSLNRRFLRERIFADHDAKHEIEAILHPAIHHTMLERSEQVSSPYCLMVIPLLAESHHDYHLDRILVIDCPVELQRERLMSRDAISSELAQAILDQQVKAPTRLALADDVINNDNAFMPLKKKVDDLHACYHQFALEKVGSC